MQQNSILSEIIKVMSATSAAAWVEFFYFQINRKNNTELKTCSLSHKGNLSTHRLKTNIVIKSHCKYKSVGVNIFWGNTFELYWHCTSVSVENMDIHINIPPSFVYWASQLRNLDFQSSDTILFVWLALRIIPSVYGNNLFPFYQFYFDLNGRKRD